LYIIQLPNPQPCGHAWFNDGRQQESSYLTVSLSLGEVLMKLEGALKILRSHKRALFNTRTSGLFSPTGRYLR
jgi:hypothetical protein